MTILWQVMRQIFYQALYMYVLKNQNFPFSDSLVHFYNALHYLFWAWMDVVQAILLKTEELSSYIIHIHTSIRA